MTFTTPCFVRVKDAAERQKLIEWAYSLGNDICIEVGEMVHSNRFASVLFDCGTNIELFKALAAMSDDTDREQWFVGNDDEYVKCLDDNFIMFTINVLQKQRRRTGFVSYHKATLEELVEHFGK